MAWNFRKATTSIDGGIHKFRRKKDFPIGTGKESLAKEDFPLFDYIYGFGGRVTSGIRVVGLCEGPTQRKT